MYLVTGEFCISLCKRPLSGIVRALFGGQKIIYPQMILEPVQGAPILFVRNAKAGRFKQRTLSISYKDQKRL